MPRRFAGLTLAAALAACAGSSAGSAVTPISILTQVQTVCAEGAPLAPLVPVVGVYLTAFCAADNLAVATLTPADLAWLANIVGELKGSVAPAPVIPAAAH